MCKNTCGWILVYRWWPTVATTGPVSDPATIETITTVMTVVAIVSIAVDELTITSLSLFAVMEETTRYLMNIGSIRFRTLIEDF